MNAPPETWTSVRKELIQMDWGLVLGFQVGEVLYQFQGFFFTSTIIQDFHFWVDLDAGREYSCLLYGRRTSGGTNGLEKHPCYTGKSKPNKADLAAKMQLTVPRANDIVSVHIQFVRIGRQVIQKPFGSVGFVNIHFNHCGEKGLWKVIWYGWPKCVVPDFYGQFRAINYKHFDIRTDWTQKLSLCWDHLCLFENISAFRERTNRKSLDCDLKQPHPPGRLGGKNSKNDQTHLRDSKLAKCKFTSMVGKSNIKSVVEKEHNMKIINKLLKVPSNYLCLFQVYHTFNHKFTILPTFCWPLFVSQPGQSYRCGISLGATGGWRTPVLWLGPKVRTGPIDEAVESMERLDCFCLVTDNGYPPGW